MWRGKAVGQVTISVKQFTILVIMYTLGSSALVIPSTLTTFAKSNAWISSIIALGFGVLFVFLFSRISVVYPEKTFVEINQIVFGKWIGNLSSLLFMLPIFLTTVGNLREIGDFFTTQVMVDTPIHAIHILVLITAIYCIRAGLEVMARTCEIFFPWTAIFLVILILFLIPEMKLENLNPNFAKGMGPIIGAAYTYICLPFSQLVVFLMILPNVKKIPKARKFFFLGVIVGGIGISLITSLCLGVLGHDFTSRNMYPTYVLGKMINIGGFIERVEVLVAISWVFTIFFKLLVNTYALILGMTQILKMNDYKPLSFPIGFLLMVFSMTNYPNIVYFSEFTFEVWPLYSLTFFLFLPLIVYIVSLVKSKVIGKGS